MTPKPCSTITDDGTPVNPKELDLTWLRNHTDDGVPPPLERPRLQVRHTEGLGFGGSMRSPMLL